MWLNLSWDEPIDGTLGIIAQGRFNLSSCGGPSDWTITQTQFEKAYFSCSYSGEPYAIIFSFYDGIHGTSLHDLSLKIQGKMKQDDKWIVILTDEKLEGYNEKEECLEGVLSGNIDQDEFGGEIFCLDLTKKDL